MFRIAPWVFSALLHGGAAGLIIVATLAPGVEEGPPVGVSPSPMAIAFDDHEPKIIEFVRNDLPLPKLALEDAPVEFEPDRHVPEPVEAAAVVWAPHRPAPPLDRPVTSTAVKVIAAAVAIQNPPPAYPALARRRGLEGTVTVEILVLPDGTCGEAKVVENSGSSLFADAALDAVRRWTYRPVACTHRVRFIFRLS